MPLPDFDLAGHIIDYLYEFGPAIQSGGQTGPADFGEIESWANMTGIDLLPWESLALRRLSVAFVREAEKAKDPKCPAPWQKEELDQQVIADGLLNFFKQMQRRREAEKR